MSKQNENTLNEYQTNLRYHGVISDICNFFDGSATTYTKLLEMMNGAQTEIGRIRNLALLTAESGDCPVDYYLENVHEFFSQMGHLLYNLKPIAIDIEQRLQDKGFDFVRYDIGERAAR